MRILLVQTSFLGDTVLSTPVIAALKELYPEAELWMMTTPAAALLVKRDPRLAGIIPFAKRGSEKGLGGLWRLARRLAAMRFDRVYSLHRSARTSLLLFLSRIPLRIGFDQARLAFLYTETRPRPKQLHDVRRNLALLAGERPGFTPAGDLRLFPPAATELPPEIRRLLPPPGSYALLVPGSAWETKRWTADGFRRVAEWLIARNLKVVLNGSPEEAEICSQVGKGLEVLNLAGKSDLETALYLARNARLIVCNDSLALHLASACKTPCVAIFCATVPAFGFGPWQNPRARIVEKQGLDCRPCARHGGRKCPQNSWECSRGLPAAEVISALKELLD
jgi:heptosyltransferase-2